MLRARRLVAAGGVFFTLLAATSACTQATTKASQCERRWSENSDTAMPHEVRGDPVASEMYHDRYLSICNR